MIMAVASSILAASDAFFASYMHASLGLELECIQQAACMNLNALPLTSSILVPKRLDVSLFECRAYMSVLLKGANSAPGAFVEQGPAAPRWLLDS